MHQFPNANQLGGRAVGSIFFACFGAAWIFLALAAKQLLSTATVAGTLTCTFVLLVAAACLLREAKRWPRVQDSPATGRAFGQINAIQWIAIAAVAFTLGRLHLNPYIPSAITGIVGLHMFPLARLFRYPLHHVTGALLVSWAAGTAVFVPASSIQGDAAMGTGIILWLSAAVTLAIGLRVAGREVPAQSVA